MARGFGKKDFVPRLTERVISQNLAEEHHVEFAPIAVQTTFMEMNQGIESQAIWRREPLLDHKAIPV